jgi:hypothetical protein
MATSAEMLSAFRELSSSKQLERSELLDLLRDGIHAALMKKYGPNVRFELNVDELPGAALVQRNPRPRSRLMQLGRLVRRRHVHLRVRHLGVRTRGVLRPR